jgi:hypothetical protein
MRVINGGIWVSVLLVSPAALAASAADVDRMTTYAVILGPGIACGASHDEASRRVGRWLGVRYHAEQQRDGKSPDSCATVRRNFSSFPWP